MSSREEGGRKEKKEKEEKLFFFFVLCDIFFLFRSLNFLDDDDKDRDFLFRGR